MMAPRVDWALVAELAGGDPVLLPEEAARQLGIDQDELYEMTQRGDIASIQPGGCGTEHRYRQSAVKAVCGKCLRCRRRNHCDGATVNCDCPCT